MKRVGNLYTKLIDVENCKTAIINASKGKTNRSYVKRILNNLDFYSYDLSNRLQNLTFVSPYTEKTIFDKSTYKERHIQIPMFYPDQCSHHAIMQLLQPMIERKSYYWSCANIPGRGMDRAVRGVKRATLYNQKRVKYCAKCDIRHFYQTLPHDRLKARLREVIKDERFLVVLDHIIDSVECGIPIGNYTSPWFAELYLNPLDHYIKEYLKVKYYIRYADDIVLIGSNKKILHKQFRKVREYIESLGLEVKPDWQLFLIYKNGRGRKIDFCGKCFARGFTTVRKHTALNLMRQSRKLQRKERLDKEISFKEAAGFISRTAILLGANTKGLHKKYVKSVNINKLKNIVRKYSKGVLNESKRKSPREPKGCSDSQQ